ncbi:NRDE family protein [Natronomonas sp. EA1]|uniref:NRDE family protein n=1 Tax=Natronomonas sp. EA1 TaxID=3421655 RepID=UPI003EB80186
MCTLTFAWQVLDTPLAVAANRDEALARPSAPPEVFGDSPRIIAPRDEEAGGTWQGYNDSNLFVALTNRWTEREGSRSRGLLVRDALSYGSAREVLAYVREELRERAYEPFHLLAVDTEDALLVEWDGDLTVHELAPGTYVVVNVGWVGETVGPADAAAPQRIESVFVPGRRPEVGEGQAANARKVLDALVAEPGEGWQSWTDRAGTVLGDHDYGVCLHGDGFGTKSSSLIVPGEWYGFADGPPCETPYESVEGEV